MKAIHPEQPSSQNNAASLSPVDRRTFLFSAAKAAAAVAAGGAVLQSAATDTLAEYTAKGRSIAVLRKPTVTLTCTYLGTINEAKGTQQLFDMFYAQNGRIKVKILAVPGPAWSTYFEKILTMIAGGTIPDMGRIATEGVRLVTAKDLVLPLDPFIKHDSSIQEFFADSSPTLVDTFRVNGKLIALPADWNEMFIHYNTKVFSSLGIPAPKPNWTGDDFLAVCKKCVDAGKFGFNVNGPGTFGIVSWMYAAGGGLYNKDLTKSTATDPANVKALQFLQDLVFKYKYSPRMGSPDVPLLEAGRVGMVPDGRYILATLEADKFHDYNVQYLPALGPNRTTMFGVGGYPIFKGTKYPEETWQAVKFMASKPALSVATKLGLSNPSRRSLANDPALALPPGVPNYNYKIYWNALAAARPIPAPPQFNEVESALDALYTKLMANEIDAAAMLAQLDKQITAILAQPV